MKIATVTIFALLCLLIAEASPRADEAPVSTSGKSLDEISDMLKQRLQKQRRLDEQQPDPAGTEQKEVLYKYQDERGQWHYSQNFYSIPQKYQAGVIEMPVLKDSGASRPGNSLNESLNPGTETGAYIYKYRDEQGGWHFSGSREGIPERYRNSIVEVPAGKKRSGYRTNTDRQRTDYGSSPLMQEIEQREAEGNKWREQWLVLNKDFEQKRQVYESIKDVPPDCTMTYLGYAPSPIDPRNADCEGNWKVLIEKARIEMEEARKRMEEYKEKARKAGIAPGYLR